MCWGAGTLSPAAEQDRDDTGSAKFQKLRALGRLGIYTKRRKGRVRKESRREIWTKGEWKWGRDKTRVTPGHTRDPPPPAPPPSPVTALLAVHVYGAALVRPQGRWGLGDEVLPGSHVREEDDESRGEGVCKVRACLQHVLPVASLCMMQKAPVTTYNSRKVGKKTQMSTD